LFDSERALQRVREEFDRIGGWKNETLGEVLHELTHATDAQIFANSYDNGATTGHTFGQGDLNYDGIVVLDHSPGMVGGGNVQTAYAFAYMRSLLNCANAEAKG
jgi:hypothetical protein